MFCAEAGVLSLASQIAFLDENAREMAIARLRTLRFRIAAFPFHPPTMYHRSR